VHIIQTVIETPRNSRNKYAYDEDLKAFVLKKVLPAGMAFPYDFGFISGTQAEDGDPMDVLILMDEPAYPGCVVHCRVIGIIEGKQTEDGKTVRNDRVVAVDECNHAYTRFKHIDDLGHKFVKELEDFFVNYHELDDTKFKVVKVAGPGEAQRRIKKSRTE